MPPMSTLPGNIQLVSEQGRELTSLRAINELETAEKERIYTSIIPPRLFELLRISPATLSGLDGRRRVTIIGPRGMGLARIEVKNHPADPHTVFFLDIADTRNLRSCARRNHSRAVCRSGFPPTDGCRRAD